MPLVTTDTDPLSPAPVEPPRYDPAVGAWVLSRYEDVLAAFREEWLLPASHRSSEQHDDHDKRRKSLVRTETLGALSASKLSAWQAEFKRSATTLIDRLPRDRAVDIVKEFAQPWSLGVALVVTEADSANAEHLRDLAARVSEATADPSNPVLESRSRAANAELARVFEKGPIPMCGPAFVALSCTLPSFLANAWLALIRHPVELARLRDRPDMMPKAIEELLRYAGLARTLFRRAMRPVDIGGVTIAEGQRVILMLSSANRDPAQFPEPNRLDLTRRSAGHFALGTGSHSCAGASLIRMAAAVGTSAFVDSFVEAPMDTAIEWRGGSGFRSVASLYVMLRHKSVASTR